MVNRVKTETAILIVAGLLLAYLFLSQGDFSLMPKTIYDNIAQAIMEFEGYFVGSISYKNNNPGNLKFVGQLNATGQDQFGHAIFPTFQDGYNALINQIRKMLNGTSSLYPQTETLTQAMNTYASANGNQYALFIAQRIGVDPNVTLANLNSMA